MMSIRNQYALPLALVLLVLVVGVIVIHPHGSHSPDNEAAPLGHTHSHSQHDTGDELHHPELTARPLTGSFIVSFATLDVTPSTKISDVISRYKQSHVVTNFSNPSESIRSLTRVFLL